MSPEPGILARGPWQAAAVRCTWRADAFEPRPSAIAAADAAIAGLQERGSPSHDGLSARLASFEQRDGELALELQPARWALRLLDGEVADSLAALCVTRRADGSWLAGRRAPWVASWAGRWALGAGGAVEVGEHPAETLTRELEEEWSLIPERVSVEALVRLPSGLVLFVGIAWVPDEAEAVPDAEHDRHAWWPSEVDAWPAEADRPLRLMASLLAAS
ncbi:MAG TPA: NUDIX domain-containing protein [Solirubrobacteraceae bacterium]|nr:NUDIX domain-containing protein [Solirubrobacteraceae bacterium]